MLRILFLILFLCCLHFTSGLHLCSTIKQKFISHHKGMSMFRLNYYNPFNPHYSRNPSPVLKPWSTFMNKFNGGKIRGIETTTKTIALNNMKVNWDSSMQARQHNIFPSVALQRQTQLTKIGFILVVASIIYSIFSYSKVEASGDGYHTDVLIQNRKIFDDFATPEPTAASWRSTAAVKKFSRPISSTCAKSGSKQNDRKQNNTSNVISSAAADCAVQVKSDSAYNQHTVDPVSNSSRSAVADSDADRNHVSSTNSILCTDSTRPTNAGFLSTFFKKPVGRGRPAELNRALHPAQASSSGDQLFRAVTVLSLINSMPKGTFTQEVISTVCSPEALVLAGDGLQNACEQAGLSNADSAEVFAEVTHALLTSLVDAAAIAVTTPKSSDPSCSVRALHSLTNFIAQAHRLFDSLFPDVTVEPIQYNGKAQSKQLEELYYRYLMASHTVDVPLGETDAAASSENWEERLVQLQFLFNLKGNKLAAIMQRVQREALLKNLEGWDWHTDVGSLGGLLDTVCAPDYVVQSPGNAAAEIEGKGKLPGLPDFSKMSQEQMTAASRKAMSQVKAMLQESPMSRADVQLFEQSTGMTVEDMLRAVDVMQRQGGEAALQRLGPDFTDMMDIFRQLREVK